MAGTTLATAYVQVMPSTKGMSANLSAEMNGACATAGASGGSILGSTVGKFFIAAFAAEKVVGAIADMIGEGGALEQSLGGIETLYKDNADTMIAYANQAFATTQLSANEYMETVTSYSAGLIASMGGDTAAAAEVANMAMIDMADNANKMGTDMQMIQNAYQGFSRQNYTMLDNLKLGYGGTKAEMERLLADAQALSGVEYNIDNLADVYEAIHVIQEELGITGTSAEEASSTIIGSVNSFKAAWSDLKANLVLGNDITQQIQNLGTTFINMAQNILPAVWNIIKGIPEAIVAMLPDMQAKAGEMWEQFKVALDTKIPELLTSIKAKLQELLNNLWTSLPGMLSDLGSKIKEFLTTIIPKLGELLPQLLTTLGQLALDLITNLPAIIGGIFSALWDILTGLISGLLEGIGNMLSGLWDIVTGIFTSIKDSIVGIWDSIKNAISNKIDAIKNAVSSKFQAIKDAIWQPIENAKNKVSEVIDKIKSFFDFHVELPHIKLPHFAITPEGWKLGDLLKGEIPHLGIEWYAKGGVFNQPTLAGIGEAGAEAVVPLNTFWTKIDNMADGIVNGISTAFAGIETGGGDIHMDVYLYPNGAKMMEETVRAYDQGKERGL